MDADMSEQARIAELEQQVAALSQSLNDHRRYAEENWSKDFWREYDTPTRCVICHSYEVGTIAGEHGFCCEHSKWDVMQGWLLEHNR